MHGACTLVAIVGTRQARLARELEKLALECGRARGSTPTASPSASVAAPSARPGRSPTRSWPVTPRRDARVPASCAPRASASSRSAYWVTRRLREALGVAGARGRGAGERGAR
jgi:hypothetical protein